MTRSHNYRIREYIENDSTGILKLVSDILVDEFNIAIDFNYLESDLLDIKSHYNKNDGSCF